MNQAEKILRRLSRARMKQEHGHTVGPDKLHFVECAPGSNEYKEHLEEWQANFYPPYQHMFTWDKVKTIIKHQHLYLAECRHWRHSKKVAGIDDRFTKYKNKKKEKRLAETS